MEDKILMEMEGMFEGIQEDAKTEEVEVKKWLNSEGVEVSRSEFIREQFVKFNKSRKEISEEFGIPYRVVYGATVNMTNSAETSRGRSVTNPNIQVTDDNKVLIKDGGKYFLNGEEVEEEQLLGLEFKEVPRNEWIRQAAESGMSRGEIAKILRLSYGVVYGITKDLKGSRSRHEVTLEDGTVVSRAEYIRMRIEQGATKSDVAKELGVDYSVVWQALKQQRTDAEKFEKAVENLAKFSDKVSDPEGFNRAIEYLKSLSIVDAEEDSME